MTETIKLFVGLKIPDTTSITAFNTLKKLGFKDLKKLEREDYYEFQVEGDSKKFQKKIQEVDILVNANKNFSRTEEEHGKGIIYVIVKDKGNNAESLKDTLKERMNFKEIKEMSKGVLWKITSNLDTAKKVTEALLYNPHYQEFNLL